MIKRIAILIPTRERLNDFELFAKSWRLTTTGLSTVIVAVDDDDPTYDQIRHKYPEFVFEHGSRRPPLDWLNFLAVKYCNSYDYVGFMEDDCTFNTLNWETIFLSKLDTLGPNGIVYGEDNVNHERLVGLPFMNSSIVKRLGYMSPPEIKYLWADNFWKDIGDRLGGLHYFPNVLIEHRHYSRNKRGRDHISELVDSKGQADAFNYNELYLKTRFESDIEKLKVTI